MFSGLTQRLLVSSMLLFDNALGLALPPSCPAISLQPVRLVLCVLCQRTAVVQQT